MRAAPNERWRRRLITAALTLAGVCLISAAALAATGRSADGRLDRRAQMTRVLPLPQSLTPGAVTSAHGQRGKQMPPPVRLVIPAIGVSAPIIRLGRNSDGTAEVPRRFSDAGWFEPGPEPGERGAAVVLGHVDSRSGPGVFYRLPALRRGDRFRIVLRDGRTLRFVVTGMRQVSKNRFPTKLVYKRTPRPTLRLITCGGGFDSSTGHYVDNYIVFAWLLGT